MIVYVQAEIYFQMAIFLMPINNNFKVLPFKWLKTTSTSIDKGRYNHLKPSNNAYFTRVKPQGAMSSKNETISFEYVMEKL